MRNRWAGYCCAWLIIVPMLIGFGAGEADGQTALPCGQTLAATISPASELDLYSFAARAGEVVAITIAKTSQTSGNFAPAWELYSPTGAFIAIPDANGGSGGICFGQCEPNGLPSNGTYSVHVYDLFMDGTGNY